ncbi:phosphatase PAP2 family protein [Ottowia sp. GY511]|uniref:Phosphatase PAP2 family protein n=1 Tax=Ottowia flava TaxID=2675430 RepID=A0ABW4KRR9_9BURK|nr:phosphatase PAP2 family protein [Ottowia sp. GY511]TXK30936.1 phosphatase PAP2 family protein [Ottowia sp. GY511]
MNSTGSGLTSLAQTLHHWLSPLAPWALVLLFLLALGFAWRVRRPAPGRVHVRAAGSGWLWLAGALALLAVALTWMVAQGYHPAVLAWDQQGAAWGAAMRADGWGAAATRLGELTSGPPMIAFVLLVALVLTLRRRGTLAWGWLLATSLNSQWVQVLKQAIARPRPSTVGDTLVTGFSFPSGHAAGAMMVFGLLAWLLCRRSAPAVQGLGALVVAAVIVCVGTSRVVLGVHYLSDVAAGFLWAGAWLACAVFALQPVAGRVPRLYR